MSSAQDAQLKKAIAHAVLVSTPRLLAVWMRLSYKELRLTAQGTRTKHFLN